MAGGLLLGASTVCRAEPATSASLELLRPIGDTYNERTTDGDAYPESLGVRATLARGGSSVWLDYRRNVFLTESRGAGSLTGYARIEGGNGTVPPFLARESSFEARIQRDVGRDANGPFYVGLGVVRTWTNYHYPVLSGVGAGAGLRATEGAGMRPFASAFYYPYAAGAYTTERLPAQAISPSFGIVKFDLGFTVRSARTPVYAIVGYANEQRSGHALPRDVRFIRSDPYLGVGVRTP